VPTIVLAAATAGYSAFLFGQAEGRDFWQSPLLLPQLLMAALAAGAASLLALGPLIGVPDATMARLAGILIAALLAEAVLLFAELAGSHANVDVARAGRLLTRGHFSGLFWGGAIVAGIVVPLALLWLFPSTAAAVAIAGLLTLIGLWVYEDIWVKTGQSIPLS
jgi:formate-dependent nitrite reductase membrane component NrfD